MLSDPGRGYLIELMIAKLLYVSAAASSLAFVPVQVVAMSATVPNMPDLARWVGGAIFSSSFRPIPLRERVWDARSERSAGVGPKWCLKELVAPRPAAGVPSAAPSAVAESRGEMAALLVPVADEERQQELARAMESRLKACKSVSDPAGLAALCSGTDSCLVFCPKQVSYRGGKAGRGGGGVGRARDAGPAARGMQRVYSTAAPAVCFSPTPSDSPCPRPGVV
jgi:hypothetical protein